MPPFVVDASTLNSAEGGKVTSTLPLVVSSSSWPFHLALPMETRTPPLVVLAEAHSLVETSTSPFVVAACTTLSRFWQWTLPFVVIAFKRTPRGTCASKLIFARRPCHQSPDSDDTPPRWQRPGAFSFAYTAQIVAPSAYSTTSIKSSWSASLPPFLPSTRAASPDARLAPISPLVLITSRVCPAFRLPCQ